MVYLYYLIGWKMVMVMNFERKNTVIEWPLICPHQFGQVTGHDYA